MTKAKTERYVVVATKSRPWSVLAGILESEQGDCVVLREARMVIYWSQDARGLYGLAASGPGTGGRVSQPIVKARVHGVEHILDCSPEARAALEASPWR